MKSRRYDRSKLRYPSDLTDEEWAPTEPLIPPAKRGGNRWTVDARERAPSTGSATAVDWPRNAQPQGARLPASRLDPPDASVIATLGVSRNCRPAASWSGFCAPARFQLAGGPDPGNPASIPELVLLDSRPCRLARSCRRHAGSAGGADIVVLPSYREGLPKSLIEAAACARPLVATDAPGCRDVVTDGVDGLLVPVCDVLALASDCAPRR